MTCSHERPSYRCPECAAKVVEIANTDPSLRERCRAFLGIIQMNGILRQGNAVDDLVAFVLAEKGRAADPSLKETLPLCLYFGSEQDRAEFVELIRVAKPGLISRKLP